MCLRKYLYSYQLFFCVIVNYCVFGNKFCVFTKSVMQNLLTFHCESTFAPADGKNVIGADEKITNH